MWVIWVFGCVVEKYVNNLFLLGILLMCVLFFFFQFYVEKMEISIDEDKKNMYSRIIVSWLKVVQYIYESVVNNYNFKL